MYTLKQKLPVTKKNPVMEEIKNNTVSTCFIECELTGNTPAFTYKLKNGWSDLKLGRILFEKEGLNKMLSQ